MPTVQSKIFARQHGWYAAEENVFGLYRGHHLQLVDTQKNDSDSKTLFVFRFENIAATTLNTLRDNLERQQKLIGYKTLETEEDVLILHFAKGLLKELKPDRWQPVMDRVIDEAERLGIEPHPAAGARANQFGYDQVNGSGIILSVDEYDQLVSEANQSRRQVELENVSYLRGAIGGLLAMLPGVVLWILLAVYAERVFVILAAGIGFLAYWGYNYAKGKQGPGTIWIVAVLTLVGVLLSTIGTTVFYLGQEGFDYADSLHYIFLDGEAAVEFLKANIVSLLIGVVAAFFVARSVDVRGDRVEPAERA